MDAVPSMMMGESTAEEDQAPSGTRIEDLPESIMAEVISLTSPRDACRCAAVSPAFRDAADSDLVWDRFLSRSGMMTARAEKEEKKKEAYLCLSDGSGAVVVDDEGEGETAVWVARESGGKCVALSARRLSLPWDDGELSWKWTPHPKSRFTEVTRLVHCTGLEIYGRLPATSLFFFWKRPATSLSPATEYVAYFVYDVADDGHRGLGFSDQETTVAVGGQAASRHHTVCLCPDDADAQKFRGDFGADVGNTREPARRDDRWLEIEMGRVHIDEVVDDDVVEEVVVSFEVLGWYPKNGLIVEGVEFRPV